MNSVYLVLLGLTATLGAQTRDCGKTYECAFEQITKQDYSSAVAILTTIVNASPENLKALNLLGLALTGDGKFAAANMRFQQVLKIDSQFTPARKNLAINEFNLKHRAEAKVDFERVLGSAPGDEVAHLYLGEMEFGGRALGAALDHYEKSGGRPFQSASWTLHYAESLLYAKQLQRAAVILGHLTEADADAMFQAGIVLGKAGMYSDAAKYFGVARNGSNNPPAAAYNQVLMTMRSGDSAGAIAIAQQMFARSLQSAEVYNLISEAYLKTGQIQQAYDALRTATELEPEAEDNYLDLAGICLDDENYDLGLEIVHIGLRHLPRSYRLYLHRGVMLAQKGLTEESEKDFEMAGRLSPRQSVPYAALAMAWMQRGETAKALEMLRARVKESPRDFMMRYVLGIALIRSGAAPENELGTEARRAFENSIRINPRFSHSHAELGKMLLKSGNVAGAVKELETAVGLDPKDGAAAYQLAQAYRRKGETARAQEILGRVTKLRDQREGLDPGAEMKRIVREGAASASSEHAISQSAVR